MLVEEGRRVHRRVMRRRKRRRGDLSRSQGDGRSAPESRLNPGNKFFKVWWECRYLNMQFSRMLKQLVRMWGTEEHLTED